METKRRTICKAITWQTSGLIVMSLIGYAMTGSFEAATGFAFIVAGLGAVLFVLHERLWSRVAWGQIQPRK